MARYVGPLCRLCRREGAKLFLKGARCFTEKCGIERRDQPPGQHGQGRQKVSEYQKQLREKQKLKRIYGLLERQFRGYFHRAERIKGITGDNLLQLLERRLDSAVYRIGFASSRGEARGLINHGHFLVNGKKVDIPSFLLKEGDRIQVKEKSKNLERIKASLLGVENRGISPWLELNKTEFSGLFLNVPSKEEIELPVNEQLVVELYSR
ncbi:MAG TPA: 30S ribosomal protein S4 [Nitrospiria bacterium]